VLPLASLLMPLMLVEISGGMKQEAYEIILWAP
jgi:hypothetical protein